VDNQLLIEAAEALRIAMSDSEAVTALKQAYRKTVLRLRRKMIYTFLIVLLLTVVNMNSRDKFTADIRSWILTAEVAAALLVFLYRHRLKLLRRGKELWDG